MLNLEDDKGYYRASHYLVEHTITSLEEAEIDNEYLLLIESCLTLVVDRRDNQVGSAPTFAGIVLLIERAKTGNLSESQGSKLNELIDTANQLIKDPSNRCIDNLGILSKY
jgi:hypothetical protein